MWTARATPPFYIIYSKIRASQTGFGLIEGNTNPPAGDPHSGISLDLDALVLYITTLKAPPTPPIQDAWLVSEGEVVFEELECATCHLPETGLDGCLFIRRRPSNYWASLFGAN
ncbi:MAG: hypothetical protein MUE54_07830 [Anaerolineae bacterium]|nr:hypothetical protein [Anaerolineae bacterium]